MASNVYANKPFLTQQMSVLLNSSFGQTGASGFTVAQTGTTLTVSGISGTPITLGTFVNISGFTAGVGVLAQINGPTGGNGDYLVDTSQTVGSSTAASITAYNVTVQDALKTVLDNPYGASSIVAGATGAVNYYQLVASAVSVINGINSNNITTGQTSGKNGLRLMFLMDDGTPILDTGKCTFAQDNTNQIVSLLSSKTTISGAPLGNSFINFAKKILIASTAYSGSISNSIVNGNETLVYGTAGGNSINENHHTRPEFLGALFKDSGVAFAKRFSSSTTSQNLYMAQRFGIGSEENLGAIRINVPVYYI
jgi:hypothetical protein